MQRIGYTLICCFFPGTIVSCFYDTGIDERYGVALIPVQFVLQDSPGF